MSATPAPKKAVTSSHHHLRWWTWLWLSLLGVIVTGEVYAVIDPGSKDTISENVQMLTLNPNPWIQWPARIVVGGLLIWLVPHFLFGIWP